MRKERSLLERFALSGNLPQPAEAALSWILALSCLAVSGYYYVLQQLTWTTTTTTATTALVPLVTYTREEVARCSREERFEQLELLLEKLSQQRQESEVDDHDEDKWLDMFRSSHLLRRLATLAMTAFPDAQPTNTRFQPLVARLTRIWPKILQHPQLLDDSSSLDGDDSDNAFKLSLIMPFYNESMDEVRKRLESAFHQCQDPSSVQLVLVLASHMDDSNSVSFSPWGQVKVVHFEDGTGRGPCLNFGARHATGTILTFCHSDTVLPHHWDASIRAQFPHASAFNFGIAPPPRYVPGLRAVEVTANLRCRLWALPYGDQCISIPATLFWYVGGYPHQCFMEDYELVTLLRAQGHTKMRMIPGAPALCAPRRWVTHGVLYVTFTNSRLVRAYTTEQAPAHEMYRQYYGRTMHVDTKSPWEEELELALKTK